MNVEWKSWNKSPPEPGMKVAIACNDMCSSALAFIDENGLPLHAEDGFELQGSFVSGAKWIELPQEFPLSFMETTEDDWY